ncbi:methyltransferase-like 26 B isoform X2 [Pseudorasbora parva]|uniref:methyltransferase-like 26 B isoform X2 n=1 Tax=Pseudorasbora parva TaxID=51549 RepID=UPI00351F01FF
MLLSPAAERSQDSLLSVLWEILEDQSHRELFGLELGSGTGQHVVHFAQEMPFVTWQPSDIKEESRNSIRAYIGATKAKTVLEPVHLDASEPWEKWAGLPRSSCDIIIAINLLQYSPFSTAEGVFKGSGQILKQNGLLMTYGVNRDAGEQQKPHLQKTVRNPFIQRTWIHFPGPSKQPSAIHLLLVSHFKHTNGTDLHCFIVHILSETRKETFPLMHDQ